MLQSVPCTTKKGTFMFQRTSMAPQMENVTRSSGFSNECQVNVLGISQAEGECSWRCRYRANILPSTAAAWGFQVARASTINMQLIGCSAQRSLGPERQAPKHMIAIYDECRAASRPLWPDRTSLVSIIPQSRLEWSSVTELTSQAQLLKASQQPAGHASAPASAELANRIPLKD